MHKIGIFFATDSGNARFIDKPCLSFFKRWIMLLSELNFYGPEKQGSKPGHFADAIIHTLKFISDSGTNNAALLRYQRAGLK